MVYETGTSSGTARFLTTDGDSIGFGGGRTSSQTVLAQKVKPPENPATPAGAFAALFLLPFAAMFFASILLPFWVGVIAAVAVAVAVWFGINIEEKKKKPVYKIQMERWLRSWVCLKCGTMWELKK